VPEIEDVKRPEPSEREIVEAVIVAYSRGAFPMADLPNSRRARELAAKAADDPDLELPVASHIGWYSPDPRAILPLEAGGLHIPGGLRRHLRSNPFRFSSDECFERVIRACARPRTTKPGEPENGLWIDESIARVYTLLHEHGHAHSIEAWLGDTLVGGIYGVHIGAAFFAESMFCRPELGGTNASNLCLVHLVAHLRRQSFRLMDVQIANDHTQRFGVIEIPREEYLSLLPRAISAAASWGTFDPSTTLVSLGFAPH
jgi:leucyl/phenylalanyl-tRNA---protein transferase